MLVEFHRNEHQNLGLAGSEEWVGRFIPDDYTQLEHAS